MLFPVYNKTLFTIILYKAFYNIIYNCKLGYETPC